MEVENDALDQFLGKSKSTSPSSARSTKVTMLSSPVAETVDFDLAKHQETILNQSEAPERSIDGGVDFADFDQHGGVDCIRVRGEAARPGDLELMPGVQAPRECLSPRRQVDKVSAAGWLLDVVQLDPTEPIEQDETDETDISRSDAVTPIPNGPGLHLS